MSVKPSKSLPRFKLRVISSTRAAKAFCATSPRLCASFIETQGDCFPPPTFDAKYFVMSLRPVRDPVHIRIVRFLYIDCAGDEVVASCDVFYEHENRDYEIHSVCVNPNFRGRGVCGEFIAQVCDHVKANHAMSSPATLRIACEVGNPAACRCYRKVLTDFVARGGRGRRGEHFVASKSYGGLNGLHVFTTVFVGEKRSARKTKTT